MSWQRLRKFTCVVKKKNKKEPTELISKLAETDVNIHPIPERMKIPIRMVSAGVSNLSRLKSRLKKQDEKRLKNQYVPKALFYFLSQDCIPKILKWFLIVLLIFLLVEVIIALWIWHLPADRFQRFVSCLGIGAISSFKEKMIYYVSCFLGMLGG